MIVKREKPYRNSKQWQAIIAAQEQSDESVAAYCRERGLNEKNFYRWRRKLPKATAMGPEGFIRIEPAQERERQVLKISTANGYRVEVPEGFDAEYVKGILAVIRGC